MEKLIIGVIASNSDEYNLKGEEAILFNKILEEYPFSTIQDVDLDCCDGIWYYKDIKIILFDFLS